MNDVADLRVELQKVRRAVADVVATRCIEEERYRPSIRAFVQAVLAAHAR